MKVCKICKSDNLEKISSTGLRVFICIILLFIPYGLFICWLPFVFEHKYICNNCGTEIKASEIITIDYREKETFIEEYKKIINSMESYIDKWLLIDQTSYYKVVLYCGQLFCIKFDKEYLKAYRVIDYDETNKTVVLSDKVGSKFTVYNKYANLEEIKFTEFGSKIINNEEQDIFRSKSVEQAETYLKKENTHVKGVKIEIA